MTQVRRVGVGVVLAAVLLAGCRIDTRVDVTLKANGSGTLRTTVTLDQDAVDQLGGAAALATAVPASDLRKAGWTVSAWTAPAGGGATVTLSHGFANQNQLVALIADLAGRNGVLRDARITHDRGWFSLTNGLGLVVDLRAPKLGVVSDTVLARRLRTLGVDPATIESQLDAQLRNALHVSVAVHLPGHVTKTIDAPSGHLTTVDLSHSSTDWDRVVKVGIALALGLLALMFTTASVVSARRDRRRRRERTVARGIPAERAPLM